MGENNEQLMQFINWLQQTKFPNASVEQVVQQVQAMSQDPQGQQELQGLVQEFQQSTGMFKKGGKIDQLVERRKKIKKVAQGGKDITTPVEETSKKADKAASKNTESSPKKGVGRRQTGHAMDSHGGQHMYEFGDINGNSAETFITVPQPGDTIVKQKVFTSQGPITNTYPQGSDQYESVMQRNRDNWQWALMNAMYNLGLYK